MSFLSSDNYIAALRIGPILVFSTLNSVPQLSNMCSLILHQLSIIIYINEYTVETNNTVLLIHSPHLTGKVLSPFLLSISRWGTGYQRKLSFQLNPP